MGLRAGVVISFLDQSLLSLANFLVGIFLIKASAKADYGHYVLVCSLVFFVVSIQNALITTQMTVLAPHGKGGGREEFCAALAAGQYLLFIPLALLSFAAAYLARQAGYLNEPVFVMLAAGTAASTGVLLREFFRCYFFRRLSPGLVLAMDILYLILLFSGLSASRSITSEMLPVMVIAITGLASLLTGAAAMLWAGFKPSLRLSEIGGALFESWTHGRWALAGVFVTWVQDQSYIYLLTMLAGSSNTAEASAARLFLAPVSLVTASFSRTLLPRWAAMGKNGETERIGKMVVKIAFVLSGIVSFYTVAVFLMKDVAADVFLTSEYRSVGSLIVLWGGLFLVQSVRSNYSWALQSLRQFRAITIANGASAIVVVVLGIFLIGVYGSEGSITAQIAGEVMLVTLLRNAFGKAV